MKNFVPLSIVRLFVVLTFCHVGYFCLFFFFFFFFFVSLDILWSSALVLPFDHLSVKQTLEPFQRQRWGNFWETWRSAYRLFRAHRYHLELNWLSVASTPLPQVLIKRRNRIWTPNAKSHVWSQSPAFFFSDTCLFFCLLILFTVLMILLKTCRGYRTNHIVLTSKRSLYLILKAVRF